MKCPVCLQKRYITRQPQQGGDLIVVDAPLYQISYPGQKEYVSPRCSECLDKLMERRAVLGKEKGAGC